MRPTPFSSITARSARILTVALLGLTAACSDTAPATAPAASSATTLAPSERPAKITRFVGDTMVTTFTYSPLWGATETFVNGDRLVIPAGAVCDPLTSGYGPSLWNTGCVPAVAPIPFVIKAWMQDGHPRIQVWPDVRFHPSKIVTLRMKDAAAAAAVGAAIAWCPTGGTTCVDEAKTDPSMQSYVADGYVFRRLKHFSGYHIILGRCDESTGETCTEGDGSGLTGGY